MALDRNIAILGIPDGLPESKTAIFRSRIFKFVDKVDEFLSETGMQDIKITVTTGMSSSKISEETTSNGSRKKSANDELLIEERAYQYKSEDPLFNFSQLVVPEHVKEDLLSAVDVIRLQPKIFEEWGLREIEPFPRTVLNFHGEPGTGKTLAAHAMAHSLNRKILVASYAQIESKFLGDAPKNVEAIFYAAARDNAVLFIDEADSLLSRRLTNATQGSERAANSLCSQLLICLEKFKGIVIFATNLVENYDKAFETRVRHIKFPMPDEKCRREIWKRHLPKQLPIEGDLEQCVERLSAQTDDVCGRDIKNAVIDAAVRAARRDKTHIQVSDLLEAIDRIKAARIAAKSQGRDLNSEEEKELQSKVQKALLKKEQETEAFISTSNDKLDSQPNLDPQTI